MTAPGPVPLSPVVRGVTVAAVVVVALVAAVVSFAHMQQLALKAGEAWRSYLIPPSIDGLVVAASMVLLTRRRNGLPGGPLAWGALGGGVLASLAANMADARPEVTAVLVAGWPAVAFAVAFELLLQQRRAEQAPDPATTELEPGAPTPGELSMTTYRSVERAGPTWTAPPPRQAESTDTELSGKPPVPADPEPVMSQEPATPASATAPGREEPSRIPTPGSPDPAGSADLVERVRQLVTESTAAGRPLGRRALAKHLDTSEHRVRVALGDLVSGEATQLNGHRSSER